MDWSKLTETELKEFLAVNGPTSYIKAAQLIFATQTPDTKFTEPVLDLCIATNLAGKFDQIYEIDCLRKLSIEKLTELGNIFGAEPQIERMIRICRFLGILRETNFLSPEILPEEIYRKIALFLSYEDLISLSRTCKIFLANGQEENFWRDKIIQDFYQIFHQDMDKLVMVYPGDEFGAEMLVKYEVYCYGTILDIDEHKNLYILTYDSNEAAENFINDHQNPFIMYAKKFCPQILVEKYPQWSYSFFQRKQFIRLARDKIPPPGKGIIIANISVDINKLTKKFSRYGKIIYSEQLRDTCVFVFDRKSSIRDMKEDKYYSKEPFNVPEYYESWLINL